MKRSQLILFSIFLGITALIYTVLSMNKKEYSKNLKEENTIIYVPVRTVENNLRKMSLVSYGQINPNTELIVSFEVQGKLLPGKTQLKPGVNFSKGQILYQIDNKEAYYNLNARKAVLANLILTSMPDIELEFPSEKNKWMQFMNHLEPNHMLPDLPNFKSEKERLFMTSKTILSEYYTLKSTESKMEKYFYAAPFSGTVVEVYAEPGSIVNPGGQVAKIAKTGDYEVKVPIELNNLNTYEEKSIATFTNTAGKEIGKGKIIRISDVINQRTQSADVYYSIQPEKGVKIYNGMFVNATINQTIERELMPLPRVAVADNKVNILKDSLLVEKKIKVVDSKPDTVFVTGLDNGEKVLLEPVERGQKGIKYGGIIR